MTDYKKCDSVIINGKKRTLYSKKGSSKRYVINKGRMMNVVKYKEMVAKKVDKPRKTVRKTTKSRKTTGRRVSKKRGGNDNEENVEEEYMNFDSALQSLMPMKM